MGKKPRGAWRKRSIITVSGGSTVFPFVPLFFCGKFLNLFYRSRKSLILPTIVPGTKPHNSHALRHENCAPEVYAKTRDLAATVSWEQLLEAGAVICGDPDHCIEKISQMREKFGFTQLLSWTRLGGFDHRKVMKSMELMQKYVIPHFRKEEEERLAAF